MAVRVGAKLAASGLLVSVVTAVDPTLVELAHAHGVATEFSGWSGGLVSASREAVVGVLDALGVDASSPDAVARALEAARTEPWRRMLPAYVVVRGGRPGRVAVHVPHGDDVEVEIELEDGSRRPLHQLMVWVDPRDIDGGLVGEATFEVPDDVPLGYHEVRAHSGERAARALLIVVPDRLPVPSERSWGFMLQLYALRSRQSWSVGDLADLAEIAQWSARDLGAGFVLVNPLHAAAATAPMEPSPYFPSSRRFVNPIYLRVEDVDEVAALPPSDVEAVAAPLRARNSIDEDLDRDAVWSAKRLILERAFAGRRDPQRARAFAEFVAAQGGSLTDFATWNALADRYGLPWRQWPTQFHDPRSAAVVEFRERERALVDFHAWLQWLCALQLEGVQHVARDAGMPIGVLHDLAVGVSPDGADSWALRDVLAPSVTLGAPADMYNQQGQRWNLPPWQPDKLAAADFLPYRELVHAWLQLGGGLRVDHIIGLFRQWWVLQDAVPADGTYLRLDHEAMVGILVLEAHRAGAVIVGEDLGNVEPWVRDYLRERGLLGTSILWFEHDDAGAPRPPEQWRELCLASVTTHDLPPTAGYLTGQHVELRAELGLLERGVDEERAADEADRIGWLRALGTAGLLEPAVVEATTTTPATGTISPRRARFAARVEPHVDTVVDALHGYVAATPARLIGVYLPDLVGDRRPINQPGTIDEYPNWRVPLADAHERPVLLDDIRSSVAARRLAHVVGARQGSVTVSSSGEPTR